MIETLEGRTLFAAVTPTETAPPEQQLPAVQQDLSTAKVTMQDFHFVMKVNKASPTLDSAKVKTHDINFKEASEIYGLNFTKIKYD
jgi:hypothetical protein